MKKNYLICIMVVMILLFIGMAEAKTGTQTAKLSDCSVTATNTIDTSTATATISTDKSCSAGLDATYDSINPYTLQTQTQRKYGSGQYGHSVSFTAENGHRSIKIETRYSVTYGGQSWSTTITTIR